ncbi:MAG: cell division protein ZapA [Burkholderiaceae bacterium]
MTQLDVSIMGQSFKLSCKAGEEAELHHAVRYLDERMSSIRDAGKVKGNDRIAVVAALGIAAELLATKTPDGPLSGLSMSAVQDRIREMHVVLDAALTPQENLF